MAEKNYHPIPGFVASLVGVPSAEKTYSGLVCPNPINIYRYDYGLPSTLRLTSLLTAAAATETYGAITANINSFTDLIQFRSADGDEFQVNDTPTARALGFTTFPTTSVNVAGQHVATAQTDWQRGSFEADTISLTFTSGPDTVTTEPVGHLNHLMQWMATSTGLDDAGDPISALRRFGINSDGHVFYTYDASEVIETQNYSYILGFRGDETSVPNSDLSWYTTTATHPLTGVWVPSRPLARRFESTENDISAEKTLNSSWAYNLRGSFTTLELECWVDGPQDSKDLYKHVLERFAPYAHPGARVDYYARWGDPRLPLQDREVGYQIYPYTISAANYNNGESGVVRCYANMQMQEYVFRWPEDLRRRAPLTLMLDRAHNLED